MKTKGLDLRPRRVWLGLTVPGKKMMTMLEPNAGIQRGWSLIDLYQGEPYRALVAAAIALHFLPEQGARFGPAFRDLTKPLLPGMLYGAILTDIRDFLKLRFHAKGLANTETVASDAIEEGIRAGNIQAALEADEPEVVVSYVVNYVITALDTLSRDLTVQADAKREEFVNFISRLRDLLRATARWLYPGGYEHYDRYIDIVFQELTQQKSHPQ